MTEPHAVEVAGSRSPRSGGRRDRVALAARAMAGIHAGWEHPSDLSYPSAHVRTHAEPAPPLLPRGPRLEREDARQGARPRRRHGVPRPRGLRSRRWRRRRPATRSSTRSTTWTGARPSSCVRVTRGTREWTVPRRHRRGRRTRASGSTRSCCRRCRPRPRSWRSTCCSRRSRRPPAAQSHVGIEAQIETARGPHQRRGDLRRERPARDDHLRPRRLRGVDRDAGAHRRRADPRVPGRPLPLRVLEDPHGRPRQRPAGDRRPVPQDPRARRACATTRCARRILGYDGKWALHPDQVHGHQRGVHADAGAVRPRLRHPRGLREGHDRGRPQGRGDVRRRDDRRGQPQDGEQVRHPRRARRHAAQQEASQVGVAPFERPRPRRTSSSSAIASTDSIGVVLLRFVHST